MVSSAFTIAASVIIIIGNNFFLLLLRIYSFTWTKFSSNSQHQRGKQTWLGYECLSKAHMYQGTAGASTLCLFRAFCFLSFLMSVLWENFSPNLSSGTSGYETGKWFSFFTNWTFLLFACNALMGFISTIIHMRGGKKEIDIEDNMESEARDWTLLEKIWLQVFNTVIVSELALIAFYWLGYSLGYSGGNPRIVDNLIRHGGACLLLIIELFISRVPIFSYTFHSIALYTSVYAIFLWTYGYKTGNWVYAPLNFYRPLSPLYYMGLVVLFLTSFAICFGLAVLRERMHSSLLVKNGRDEKEEDPEDEERIVPSMPSTSHNSLLKGHGVFSAPAFPALQSNALFSFSAAGGGRAFSVFNTRTANNKTYK